MNYPASLRNVAAGKSSSRRLACNRVAKTDTTQASRLSDGIPSRNVYECRVVQNRGNHWDKPKWRSVGNALIAFFGSNLLSRERQMNLAGALVSLVVRDGVVDVFLELGGETEFHGGSLEVVT